ncbi:hypothetical protein B0I35DRAFT_513279 [Stachybotrys elegans]|uniref:DUF6546 domain-containing protein n=1 Tax=Stachybotrys elegans TaxID=80388 RepID=A0A8K0SS92_9HYPO|nr:hypothetical protein B0I35DRAFT_513279 [Stachybotrys elegans]
MAGWNQLPAEIRRLVFDYFLLGIDLRADRYARARAASVCREWQGYFEWVNFETLLVDQDRLQDLEGIVGYHPRRQARVRTISMRVRLDEYDCSECMAEEDHATSKRNEHIFVNALFHLLLILSKWEPRKSSPGIDLDLGVYSPSDGQHGLRDFRLSEGYDILPSHDGLYLDERLDMAYQYHHSTASQSNLSCPGWSATRREGLNLQGGKRLVATVGDGLPLCVRVRDPRGRLIKPPKVGVLTSLAIRRQYYRHISCRIVSKVLRESMVNVRQVRYETWELLDSWSHTRLQRDICRLLSDLLPMNLCSIHLFQESNPILYAFGPRWPRPPIVKLGALLAELARNLKEVSASFLVDACNFFTPIDPSIPGWKEVLQTTPFFAKLEHLALTTHIISEGSSMMALEKVLISAGAAALYRMPCLKIMEVWEFSPRFDEAYVFRIEIGEAVKLKVYTGLLFHMSFTLFDELERMSLDAMPKKAFVAKQVLWQPELLSFYEPLSVLKLRNKLLHPLSLSQIRHEHGLVHLQSQDVRRWW